MKRITTLGELNENECYYLTERVPYHSGGGVVEYRYTHQPFYLREKMAHGIDITTINPLGAYEDIGEVQHEDAEFVELFLPLEHVYIDTNFEPPKDQRATIVMNPNQKKKDELIAFFVTLRIVDKIGYRHPDKRKREKATFGAFQVP